MKNLLLSAPETQIDSTVKSMIAEWSEEPEAEQILKVLDHSVRYSLVSGFVVKVLETMLESAMRSENKDMDTLIKAATWRRE